MPDVFHPTDGPDEDDDLPPPKGIDDGDFVLATVAEDRIEASLLVSACEDAGIPAIFRAPRDSMVGKIDAPAESLEILVRVCDLPRARLILADRKAVLESDPAGAEKAAEEESSRGE